MAEKPLAGIKVIDVSRVLAGPYATMLLADMGAEVIKIERPGQGDDSRNFGPFINGKSAYFMSVNRGKKSVVLDLKDPEDRERFKDLIRQADVLVENFRPGAMERLGLGYDSLSALNPRLIYAACSGFGQQGPYSLKPA
ncbi:MAG TPA: CoA transferase, partial [Bacillota bacterium]|nr:CoA transferase [Bacillota bacterium]